MYAPKRIFFFDFDKIIPRLAMRWGGAALSQALHIYACVCRVCRVCRWCVVGVVGVSLVSWVSWIT